MAITSAITTSAKTEFLQGIHLAADVYKLLLLKVGATGTYGAATTNVGTPGTGTPSASNVGTDEASGTGYTSGGATMSGYSVSSSGTTAWLTWSNVTFTTATISAIGCIIYNSTRSNKAIACFDFGGTITSTAGTYTITMPTADATNALIRLA